MIIEFILLALSLVLLYQWMKPHPPKNFPPGPPNYPIVGGLFGLLKLGSNGGECLANMKKHYGPISGIYFGKTPSIIINDYELMKEISSSDSFSHRPRLYQLDFLHGKNAFGVFFSNGELWKEQRRFTLRSLRDCGFGKTSLEDMIHEEAEDTLRSIQEDLDKSPNSVCTVHDKFGISMINIIWYIVAGERFSHKDQTLKHIMHVIYENFRSGNATGNLIQDYPWLTNIPIANRQWKKFLKNYYAVYELLEKSLQEHKATRDPSFNRDFYDVYLQALENETKKGNSQSTFSERQLLATAQDLFNAGAESTSNTVAFALLYMILYPDAQAKLHAELDKVVGRDRLPSMADKPNLHYVEAVMTECYRVNPISPTTVPHSCVEDVTFRGFSFPKNSFITMSMISIHKDPEHWKDPEAFRPERFLDSNGHFVKSLAERVVTFGMGKRNCLGEPLARMSAFLLFTAVMQRYTLSIPAGSERPSEEPVDGFTTAPQPFSAKMERRK